VLNSLTFIIFIGIHTIPELRIKMKLEQIEFENEAKLQLAIEKVINGEEVYRNYNKKDGEEAKKKIISNNRLYIGNNYSININKTDTGKIYLSIDYFGAEDRIRLSKLNNNKNTEDI